MEWKKVKIGEIGKVVTGKTPRTSIAENYGGNIPFLTPSDDLAQKFAPVTNKTLTEQGLREVKNCLIPANSVCVSCIGSDLGKVVMNREPLVTNQQINSIIPHEDVDAHFVYYAMIEIGKHLNHLSKTSTAVPIINKSTFSNTELAIPSLEDQRRIVAVLSSLDDKIENNNRINANLEAQAQALFKSWFVDFEPWGGKMPEDWGEGVYNDIIEKTISGDWGKERPEGNYDHSVACIRGCDFEDINNGIRGKTPQRYILEKNYQNKGLKNRDIVVEISGGTATVSTGRVCLITEKLLQKYDYDIVCTNFCRTIRPLADYYTYLYYSWKYKYDQRIMFGYENGTSGIKNFAIKDFIEKEPLIIPSCDVVKSFNKVISVLHDKSQENGTESSRLAALRDTLLPKLMKGEIAV